MELDTPGRFDFGFDLVGHHLSGRYRVQSVLGAGGMGAVYGAIDENLSRRVVVKVPHVELLANPKFRTRFDREIRSLIGLDHPHVVKVLDVGLYQGLPFAILQYLGGGNLEDRLAKGTQTPAEVMAWLPDVARALDFIHKRGFVHRDVKPENIMFDDAGHAYVGDFGIARLASETDGGLTQTGFLVGSPRYMPPEAGTGGEVGPAYDQYALAVVVYRAVCGRLPHEGDTPVALMTQKVSQPAADLGAACPSLPVGARNAVMKTLASRPSERHATCEAFADAFAAGLRDTAALPLPIASSRPGSVDRTVLSHATLPAHRARPVERVALVAVSLALLAVLGWQFGGPLLRRLSPPEPAPQARESEPALEPPVLASEVASPVEALAPPVIDEPPTGEAAATGDEPLPDGIEIEAHDDAHATVSTEEVDGATGATGPALVHPGVTGPGALTPPVEVETPAPAGPSVEELLAEAARLHRRSQWTEGDRNAVSVLREVLAVEPENAKAQALLGRMQRYYLEQGRKREAAGDAKRAREEYEKAAAILESEATREALDGLESRLATAREAPASTPAKPAEAAPLEPPQPPVAVADAASPPAPAVAEVVAPTPEPPALVPIGRNARGHELFTRTRDGSRVVRIRGSTFRMGSPDGDGEPDERPQHEVTVPAFLLDEREVTWTQYEKYMKAHGIRTAKVPSFGSPPDHPVVNLDWATAKAYCNWVGGRLPTEAEWELAARGLDGFTYPWGNSWVAGRANWGGADGHPNTSPVGTFPAGASPFGVLDMVGNASEWVADSYDAGYYATSPDRDPQGPPGGATRVARGGNYNVAEPADLRAANRWSLDPGKYFANYGCRCAMDP